MVWLSALGRFKFPEHQKKYPSTYADLPSDDGVDRCNPEHMWEIEAIAHGLAPVLSGHQFVVGGDLNSSLLFDEGPGGQEARLFQNLAAKGFVDTRARHFPDEVQTYFKRGKRALRT